LAAYRAALMLMRLAIAVVNSVNCAAQSRRMQLPAGRASFPLTQLIPLVASPRRLARAPSRPPRKSRRWDFGPLAVKNQTARFWHAVGLQLLPGWKPGMRRGSGDALFIALVPRSTGTRAGRGSFSDSLLTLSEFSVATPRRIPGVFRGAPCGWGKSAHLGTCKPPTCTVERKFRRPRGNVIAVSRYM
jgi:hypothetical protein